MADKTMEVIAGIDFVAFDYNILDLEVVDNLNVQQELYYWDEVIASTIDFTNSSNSIVVIEEVLDRKMVSYLEENELYHFPHHQLIFHLTFWRRLLVFDQNPILMTVCLNFLNLQCLSILIRLPHLPLLHHLLLLHCQIIIAILFHFCSCIACSLQGIFQSDQFFHQYWMGIDQYSEH